MQNMLEDYLAFARSEESECVKIFDLNALMQKFSTDAHLHKHQFSYTIESPTQTQALPRAFTRLISNLVPNAFCHSNTVKLTAISQQECFPYIKKSSRNILYLYSYNMISNSIFSLTRE